VREGLTRLFLLLVVALFCLPLFVGLGRTDLANDEAIYSFAVDRMLETGDWLTPKSSPDENAPFLEKPPLKFWIVAAPIRLGLLPHNEFGLRFWDALFGAAAFVYVYVIGCMVSGPMCGLFAVAALFVHAPLLFEHGLRSNNMEAPLLLAYCGGICHFLRWTRNPRRGHALAVVLFFVLGFMTKFVAVLFLPVVLVLAAAVVTAWRRQVRQSWRTWTAATAAGAILVVPWFAYEHVRFGSQFWEIIFGEHVFKRMTVSIDPGHLQPWNRYFVLMYRVLLRNDTFPLALCGAAILVVNALRRRGEYVLIALWFAVPMLLISSSPSKIYHYAYPFVPPVGIMAALLPAWLWRIGQPRMRDAGARVDAWLARRAASLLAFTGNPVVSTFLVALAGGAVVLAVLGAAGVRIRFDLAPGVGLRNTQALRPWIVAFVLAALAGRARLATRLLVPVVLLALAPVTAYSTTLARLPFERHPQRDARDCVLGIIGADPPPGAYVQIMEGSFLHSYYYYFRRFGPWEWVHEPDDPGVYSNLFGPDVRRPVLVSDQRYLEFRNHLRTADAATRMAFARAGGVPVGSVTPASADLSEPMVSFDDVLLLLPGRFQPCSADARAERER
jgi:4-amino-4-deoxy-L-arabinose transferase-like glycosyltransferase